MPLESCKTSCRRRSTAAHSAVELAQDEEGNAEDQRDEEAFSERRAWSGDAGRLDEIATRRDPL